MKYRKGVPMRVKRMEALYEQLDRGVIDPASSEWTTLVVLVPEEIIRCIFVCTKDFSLDL